MPKLKQSKYPAAVTVHWSTGPVDVCEEHAKQLVTLANFLGSHVAVTELINKSSECKNCINEAEAKEN